MIAILFALALPNLTLTPGVVRPLTMIQICATTWGRDHRHVSAAMKRQVLESYGLTWAQRGCCEIDHLIPRELGGADAVANLWPQPWSEARRKDRAENAAHRAVCAGSLRLDIAQAQLRQWGR